MEVISQPVSSFALLLFFDPLCASMTRTALTLPWTRGRYFVCV